MIDRISLSGQLSGLGAGDLQKVAQPASVAQALASGLQLGSPLREMASAAAGQVQSALGGSPVAGAQLERAVLDFGREAKAYTIAHPEQDAGQHAVRMDQAIEAGAAHAASLPDTFTPIDRATALFDRAANHLSGQN